MPSYKILFFGKKDDNIDKILDRKNKAKWSKNSTLKKI